MSKIFSVERPIRFSHCDPAGIVYFAHFFECSTRRAAHQDRADC